MRQYRPRSRSATRCEGRAGAWSLLAVSCGARQAVPGRALPYV